MTFAPRSPGGPFGIGLLLLLAAAILVVAASWGLELRSREQDALQAAVQATLVSVTSELDHHMAGQIGALARLAARWEGADEAARERWNAEVQLLLDDFPSFQAIEWVDPQLRARWVAPLEGNEAVVGLDLGFEARRREALEAARDRMTVVATRPIDLVQGGKGFLVYVPLRRAGRFDGFALGVFRLEVALGRILQNLAGGYAVRIWQGEELLFAREEHSSRLAAGAAGSVSVANLSWQIEIAPSSDVAATYRTRIPELTMLGGALYALVLTLVLHLARTRRARAAQLFDANERLREAECAERDARTELAAILENFPDHVWTARAGPEIGFETIYFSPVIGEIAGFEPRYFEEDPERWIQLVDAADRERVRSAYEAVVAEEEDGLAIEYRIKRSDGQVRWIRDRVGSLRVAGEHRLFGVISDISDARRAEEERRRLETQLQQTQKLESLGVLAGGIAHDFNNLLVASLGHASLALDSLPEDAPARAHIARIERSARRAAELCRQLLDYAGRGGVEFAPLDLRELIEDLAELLSAARSKKVALRHEFEADLPSVQADAGQLRQVVLNLITNASEAIGDRPGEIRVSATAVECDREALDALQLGRGLEPGRYVSLEVSDDGCGMDAHTRRHFFEPFFSTKFSGRGLGLAAVLGIVRGHGGAIRVESVLGRGTTITVLLPALACRVAPQKAAPEPLDTWKSAGTVLVIDDEEDAREVGSLVLQRVGFDTVTAVDGEHGLEVFRGRADDVVCIVLDLTMPRLDGVETHRMLRELSEDVPVILCSGYPEREAVERFAELGLAGFVHKPYTPEELVACVRRALAAAQEAPPA